MGLLIRVAPTLCLLLSCASKNSEPAKPSEAEVVAQALQFQADRNWVAAEKSWNKLSPQSPYFSRAFYETQKLSYRLEQWNVFFAKAEIYSQAFHEKIYCPDLYLLQAFANIRNCLFADAQRSLDLARTELAKATPSDCSLRSKADLLSQIEKLSSVLAANKTLKSSEPLKTKEDPTRRNLWKVNPRVFQKIQTLPLEQGLSFVGVDVRNKCGS